MTNLLRARVVVTYAGLIARAPYDVPYTIGHLRQETSAG